MKKLFRIAIVLGIVLTAASCSSEEEKSPGYVKINDVEYKLNFAEIDDNGSNLDEGSRDYELIFQATDELYTSHFVNFDITSTSTERLQEGEYVYDYWGGDKGQFTWLKIGAGIKYDSGNEAIEGLVVSENGSTTGTLSISKSGGDYQFDGAFTMTKGDDTYQIEFFYKGTLEAVTYISTPVK